MSFHVESHLHRFIHSLEHDIPIIGYGKGRFDEVRWYQKYKSHNALAISIAKTFFQAIDQIEKSYRVVENSQWIQAGNMVVRRLKACGSREAEKIGKIVQQRLCGLKYRAGRGREKNLDDDEKIVLMEQAMSWKESQTHFNVRSWEGADQDMISDLIKRYPTFVRLIKNDRVLAHRFFNWTIRDRMSVSSFVEFPKTQELFEKLRVSPGFSKAGPRKLQITALRDINGRPYKFLSYPVLEKSGPKQVRVWDKGREFEFSMGYKATLRDIYKAMREKNKYWVDFIISVNGFENWNPAEWGPTNERGEPVPINLEKEGWLKNVPVSQKLTLEEARNRYGHHLNGRNFGVALRAARRKQDLDINRAHAFFELCIPDENGDYDILFPGKFTRILPTSFFDLVTMLGTSVDAAVVSHDHNAFYPWRQQTRYSVVVEKDDFAWFSERLRLSVIEAKKGNMAFSALGDSCSTWTQKLMNDLLERLGRERENFFNMRLIDSQPKGLLKWTMKAARKLPKCVQDLVLRITIFLFMPWRSKTIYDDAGRPHKVSALTSRSWKTLTFDNPAFLFHRQIHERVLLPSGVLPEWIS